MYRQCVVSCLPVHAYYPPSYKDWLTSVFLFCLLIIISAYLSCLPIRTDWVTNILLPMYIYLGWLPFSLIDHLVWFLSCIPVWVNYRPTYMPTYLSWLRNTSAFLSCPIDQCWLTDQCTCLPVWADWLNKPTGWGWPTNKYTCLHIRANIHVPAFLTWLTDRPAYLVTSLGWLSISKIPAH